MGISLYGLTPATTYDALIKTGDNEPLTASLKVLSDGVGTNLPMEASTTGINFTGSLLQGGVAVPTAAQVAAKQDTLVSGTNIKTINGTSVLGSGNIVTPSTPPSGVAGAIQFSNGSAFASDATNFFWDNTNKRLGVGTNTPAYGVDISSTVSSSMRVRSTLSGSYIDYLNSFGSTHSFGTNGNAFVTVLGGAITTYLASDGTNTFGNSTTSLGARVGIKGSGSTSATTSLLVQNSAGSSALTVKDDLSVIFNGTTTFNNDFYATGANQVKLFGYSYLDIQNGISGTRILIQSTTVRLNNKMIVGTTASDAVASAQFQIDSTTTGFLPPRMTTTQINAIASPAAGLEVYNTTLACPCFYDGTAWRKVSHTTM